MIYICVICTSKQPPLLFLSAEQRQLFEAILSPPLNIPEIRTRQLLLCSCCMNQVQALQAFRHTALEGTRKLLQLYKLIEQNNGAGGIEVSVKQEPVPEAPVTKKLSLTEELDIKFEPECDDDYERTVATYDVPLIEPTPESVQTFPTKPSYPSDVPMPMVGVIPQPTHTVIPQPILKPSIVQNKPPTKPTQGGLAPGSHPNAQLVSWQVPPLERPKPKRVPCSECNKLFASNSNLKQHHLRAHSGSGPVKCDICDVECKNEPAMRHHRLSHKAKPLDPETLERLRLDWFCTECQIQFPSAPAYKQHRLSLKHSTRDVWRFECEMCQRKFPDKRRLDRHMDSIHLDKKAHKCHKCEKSYISPTGLRLHISTVHDKVPLPKKNTCHYCGDSFTTKSLLSDHINTHTGDRPHVCKLCGDTFGHKSALYLHGRFKHKIPYKTKKEDQSAKTKRSKKKISKVMEKDGDGVTA